MEPRLFKYLTVSIFSNPETFIEISKDSLKKTSAFSYSPRALCKKPRAFNADAVSACFRPYFCFVRVKIFLLYFIAFIQSEDSSDLSAFNLNCSITFAFESKNCSFFGSPTVSERTIGVKELFQKNEIPKAKNKKKNFIRNF